MQKLYNKIKNNIVRRQTMLPYEYILKLAASRPLRWAYKSKLKNKITIGTIESKN